uniref:Major facilitator superfamily MFS_1 n=1 Tax=Caulobacter sp. (strain K31) TaxID=366602 RepID=B0T976_CAUSK
MNASKPQPREALPLALFVLTLSIFAIGTSEFAIAGLLTEVASDLSVSISAAGRLVAAYALGVAIGGPIMAVLTARLPRKTSLMVLMAIFAVGNAACALAIHYEHLALARVVTSLGHGAFFGIGAVLAMSLVPDHRKASAVAVMFAGLTIANILGVPLGTALGQWAGWRAPFWAITALSIAALVAILTMVPDRRDDAPPNFADEARALADGGLWVALLTTVAFATSIFLLFSYVAPLLTQASGVSPGGLTLSLLSIGLSLAVGNILGGRLADWNLGRALVGIAVVIAAVSGLLAWSSAHLPAAEINWFAWGVVTFAAVPASQVNVMQLGHKAPNLVSTLNISAFNIGIATGSWLGGQLLDQGARLTDLPLAAASVAVAAAALAFASQRIAQGRRAHASAPEII